MLTDLPDARHHGLKTIHFGPDGLLYVGIGSPCNVCEPKPPYGTISRFALSSPGKLEVYASGIRNSEGFDWGALLVSDDKAAAVYRIDYTR